MPQAAEHYQSSVQMVETILPDGSARLDVVGGQFMIPLTAHIDCDGKIITRHEKEPYPTSRPCSNISGGSEK